MTKRWKSDFLTPHTKCSTVVQFSQNTCDLSVAAQLGETTVPIYWQAQGRENTISCQKTSHPEQILILTQTYTHSHMHDRGLLSLYLCSTQETSSPSALICHVCMQAVTMHVITLCGVFICLWLSFPHRREKAWFPVGCSVCSEEEHAFLKLNPEHTAALFLSW